MSWLRVKTGVVVTVATAGTAVQVEDSPVIIADNVLVQADPDNTGNIYLGDSNVDSNNGIVILPGQALSLEGSFRRSGNDELRLSEIYVDADNNGDSARVLYFSKAP